MRIDVIHQHMVAAIEASSVDNRFRAALLDLVPIPTAASLWTRLTYWSGLAVREECQEILEIVVAATTLVRVASGVLDDLQDADTNGAAWRRIGAAQTINVGVALSMVVPLVVAKLQDREVPLTTVNRIQHEYAQLVLRMCSGQYLDILGGGSLSSGPDMLQEYWSIVEAKTASFSAFSCRMAVLAVGGTEEQVRTFSDFGHLVGILHQAVNDLAALDGLDGKKDIERGWSAPVLYAWSMADSETRTQLQYLLQNKHIDQARQLITQLGAPYYVTLLLAQKYTAANVVLDRVDGNPTVIEHLRAMLSGFVQCREAVT